MSEIVTRVIPDNTTERGYQPGTGSYKRGLRPTPVPQPAPPEGGSRVKPEK